MAVKVNLPKGFEVLDDDDFVREVGRLILTSAILENVILDSLQKLGSSGEGKMKERIAQLRRLSAPEPGADPFDGRMALDRASSILNIRGDLAHGLVEKARKQGSWIARSKRNPKPPLLTVEGLKGKTTELRGIIFAVLEMHRQLLEEEKFAATPGGKEYRQMLSELWEMNRQAEIDFLAD
jgi:hypothetical protein